MEARIRIFVGAYGSGKTEVALNYVLARRRAGARVAIADLDLVNPYFRSRELRGVLEEEGVKVIAPQGALADADLPIIVPEVQGYLQNPDWEVVLDVGGDDAGSRALGRFVPYLRAGSWSMSMVLNDRRPWTGDTDGIEGSIGRVQSASRLVVHGLVSNPNLAGDTTAAVVRAGHATIARAAESLGLPIDFVAVLDELVEEVGDLGAPVFPITRHLFPPWYEDALRFAPSRDRRAVVMGRQSAERVRSEEQ